MAKSTPPGSAYRPLIALGCIVLTTAALYWAQTVLIPLALAVLLTFVLAPLVALLQRTGLPRVPAVILVVLFALIVVGAIGSTLTMQVQRLAIDLPQYKENIVHKTAGLR